MKKSNRIFLIALITFLSILSAQAQSLSQKETLEGKQTLTPSGVVLYNSDHKRISHARVSSNELKYFSWPRGPFIENKYTAYRFLLSAEFVGAFDPFSKKQYVCVFPYFDDPKFNKGANHAFGSDVYHTGNMAGLGSPMFKVGDDWVKLPFFNNTDSIVVDLLDTSTISPRYRLSYKGWAIDGTQKIDVELEVYTSWEERHIFVQLKVTGFSGQVGVGLQPVEGILPVKDANAATMYHYGIFPNNKEMLQAVHVAPVYFDSFATDDQAEIMVLKSDASGVLRWSFLYSWSEEPSPLFKEANWQKKLIYSETSSSDRKK